jgi:hypothetical protein
MDTEQLEFPFDVRDDITVHPDVVIFLRSVDLLAAAERQRMKVG